MRLESGRRTIVGRIQAAEREHKDQIESFRLERREMLVKAFGTYWNPELVDWGSRGRNNAGSMLGVSNIDGNNVDVDVWGQTAIYALYDNFRLVYIGKVKSTDTRSLGVRLREHRRDRFAGRWDSFSWFGLASITALGNLRAAGTRQLGPDVVLSTLESIGIALTDAPLNRQRPVLPDAAYVEQKSAVGRHQSATLHEILTKLEELTP